ncbi:unnamed protein product [Toxocara canis]|uniref:GCV_T domain-containing protein n=1 Tax=Toxocara canis TaxID=6265 RepID=A0A183TWB9_TOXCA|nr:unnamed protein product [Toxocara canis]
MKRVVRLVQRALLSLQGKDTRELLQGLTTSDMRLLGKGGALYTLLLNSRGRIEYDLIVYERGNGFLVECDSQKREVLKRVLEMYRMHKKVTIEPSNENVFFVEGACDGAVADPRVPAFGNRLIAECCSPSDVSSYEERRFEFGIAEGGMELRGALPVYRNADLMNGVSGDKGCYLGQEVTAQTLRSTIKKRVLPFTCDGAAKGRIVDFDRRTNMGEVLACNGHRGIALLRLDNGDVSRCLKAGDVSIRAFIPSWWPARAGVVCGDRMSAKQLQRYLEVTRRLKKEELCGGSSSESEEESEKEEQPRMNNRFAFLGEDSGGGKDLLVEDEPAEEESENVENKASEDVGGRTAGVSEEAGGKKVRKRNKKKKKPEQEKRHSVAEFAVDSSENGVGNSVADRYESVAVESVFERDIFKVDARLFNYENELRRLVGQKPIESMSRNHRRGPTGRIVKKKAGWPEVKNVGMSMELDRTEGEVEWYKFSHNAHYRQLQQAFWQAADAMDQNGIMAILQECPYHLDSLLVMANVTRNQEEHRTARDFIERGIFFCESIFAPRFRLHDFNHRIDYKDFENRAFFLLLHRHMRTLIERSLTDTALAVAKLIYRLDPENDPLAILLVIDSLAIRAHQPRVLLQITEATQLAVAIRHFPTLVLQLLDKLNVQPDAVLENNPKMGTLAYQRESEGIKLLTSIYIAHAHDLWRECEVLRWLEDVTASTVKSFENYADEMAEWQTARSTFYIGIPRNVRRHALLWDLEHNTDSILTDPAPPLFSRSAYVRASRPLVHLLGSSFVFNLMRSLVPDMDQVNVGFINSNMSTNENMAHK